MNLLMCVDSIATRPSQEWYNIVKPSWITSPHTFKDINYLIQKYGLLEIMMDNRIMDRPEIATRATRPDQPSSPVIRDIMEVNRFKEMKKAALLQLLEAVTQLTNFLPNTQEEAGLTERIYDLCQWMLFFDKLWTEAFGHVLRKETRVLYLRTERKLTIVQHTWTVINLHLYVIAVLLLLYIHMLTLRSIESRLETSVARKT